MDSRSTLKRHHRRRASSSEDEQDTSSDASNRTAYRPASSGGRHRSDDSRDQWEPPKLGETSKRRTRAKVVARQRGEGGVFDRPDSASSATTDAPWSEQALVDDAPPLAHLKMVRQPEDKHRARYLSEGSRGAVKDSTRTSFVTVQLVGYSRPTNLQVYAGVPGDSGQPHHLYRVIKVQGKTGSHAQHTPCTEGRTSEGVHCLNITMRPEHNMVAVLDCVGILKVCSTGGASVSRRRHATSSAREKHSAVTLVVSAQTISSSIQCVQQLGHPEMFKVSTQQATVSGGQELMIIGRNFDNSTSLLFREYKETGELVWSAEADLDKKLLGQCHMVATIPTYRQLNIVDVVEVSMTVKCGSKSSHPMTFQYHPAADVVTRADVTSSWGEWMPPTSSVMVKQSPTPMPSTANGHVFEQQPSTSSTTPAQQQQQYQLLSANQAFVYEQAPAPMLTTVSLPPSATWTASTSDNVTSSSTFTPQTTVYPQFQEGTPLIEYIHQHQQPTLATVTMPTVTTETLERGDVERVAHVVGNQFEHSL